MGKPETPEDKARVVAEYNRLLRSWNNLGMEIHQLTEAAKQPVHPPAALCALITTLINEGFIPTVPLYGSPDDMKERDIRIIVGTFRWAQRCAQDGVKFDDLLQCVCADVASSDFENIYTYLNEL